MSQAKKFGTFAGVFTPSFLSIVGVIMYLRLGWVVGETGLVNALAIIIVAHIISITTGLSISSIATDKKIKGGGIYYMLSRSLGLPMGGAIGITIFIAMSLNIALHLIGFAENFVGVEAIRNTFHLGNTINDIRIVGSAAILMIVVIAFISTSLAVKSQFIIFATIVLSLVAIGVGLFINVDIRPEEIALQPRPDGMSFEAIFAIFFPAATGFTIGVAMSGDLKDPRKSIPRGTMLAILTGLAIYIILAVLFAYMVERDLLVNDYNFLTKIALWSPLVIAGIWGATLSSGLGGIMGAPRVMQAIARDKIMPRFLGKGFGINNEPRNALLLTFAIAQIAILIGELNVVARIASMFYMVAYGFINLSYVLESWASPDFRPTFKIPKWVGIAGFIVCFAVMFKLDALAMIIAVILMFLVYFYLSGKKLRLEYGDVWQSVWSSVVRSSLNQIAKQGLEERNWQPNIVLFSGGTTARPHLIEFGHQLIGSQGLLSNFDLVQIETENMVLPRHKQVISEDEKNSFQGFFSRKHYCIDIYEGIKTISSVYGFSGIEPNTVMLGWARQSQEPEKFIQTINYIKALDLNILLMDYDKRVGFGKYSKIDIWWRTTEHNGNLGLVLLKFLWLSNEWKNAKARILIVNPVNEQKQIIYKNTSEILETLRIRAEIKIINNQIEQRSFYDIVQVESINSDLIFMGLPEIEHGKETEFVEQTNKLCSDIGTVVLIKASTTFKELRIGVKNILIAQLDPGTITIPAKDLSPVSIFEVDIPGKPEVEHQIRALHSKLVITTNKLIQDQLSNMFNYQTNLIAQIEKTANNHFESLRKKLNSLENEDPKIALAKYNTNVWFRFRRLISDFSTEVSEIEIGMFAESIKAFRGEVDRLIEASPEILYLTMDAENLRIYPHDALSDRLFKIRHQLNRKIQRKKYTTVELKYRRHLTVHVESSINAMLFELFEKWGIMSSQFLSQSQHLFNSISTRLLELEVNITPDKNGMQLLESKKAEITRNIRLLEKLNDDNQLALSRFLSGNLSETLNLFADEFRITHSNRTIYRRLRSKMKKSAIRKFISDLPPKLLSNQRLQSDAILLDLGLISLLAKLKIIFNDTEREIAAAFNEHIIHKQQEMRRQLTEQSGKALANPKYEFSHSSIHELEHSVVMQALFNQLIQNTFNKIKQASRFFPDKMEIIDPESLKVLHHVQYKRVNTQIIHVSRLLDYLLQSEFVDSVQRSLDQVSERLIPIKTTTNEIVRSLEFKLNPDIEMKNGANLTPVQKKEIFAFHITQLDKEIELASQLKNTVVKMFHERMNTFEDKLTFYSFIENANHLKDFIRQREIRKGWTFLRNLREKGKSNIQRQLNQFWYRQSIGVIFTKKLKAHSAPVRFRINDALAALETISIKPEVDAKLPFFYRQLFIRKQYYLNELWTGREKELREAERAVARSLSGISGAIMVTGDHHSGKTFFSQYFISRFYSGANVFTLTPPYAGSTDVNLFKKSLENIFETSGSYYKIFNSLPEKSVLIVDDLALWWEQTGEGYGVVAQLIDLIDKYSNRCLFVINLNRFSYELMRRMHPIENYFLSIIELQPFTAEELQEIIMKRHNTLNLKLRMHNRLRDNLRTWDYAKLFSKYFTVSGGNVGVALQSWLANIEEVKDDTLYIRMPQQPDISTFDALKPGWFLIIIQLMLHKRANLRKLARICRDTPQEIKENIDILFRSGIIVEKTPGVYELNTMFYPHLQRKLIEKDMI